MPAAVSITSRDYTAAELRREASDEADVAHRILVLALVPQGKSRGEAATSGGMDRQTLRDRVSALSFQSGTNLSATPFMQ